MQRQSKQPDQLGKPGVEAIAKAVYARPPQLLASGEGDWEDIGESWRMAEVLGAKGIPNRVDSWGPEYRHDWPTWHRMLPQYLRELT